MHSSRASLVVSGPVPPGGSPLGTMPGWCKSGSRQAVQCWAHVGHAVQAGGASLVVVTPGGCPGWGLAIHECVRQCATGLPASRSPGLRVDHCQCGTTMDGRSPHSQRPFTPPDFCRVAAGLCGDDQMACLQGASAAGVCFRAAGKQGAAVTMRGPARCVSQQRVCRLCGLVAGGLAWQVQASPPV
jgi:hypothetical protein